MITVLPEGLLTETRKTLCFNDDQLKPSKFEMFYEDKEGTTVIKLNLFFTPGNPNKGIINYQVISPEDNINLEENYTKIPRPIMVETYESFGEFGILINTLSIDNNSNRSIDEKTRDSISKNWEFIKKIEAFLIAKNSAAIH